MSTYENWNGKLIPIKIERNILKTKEDLLIKEYPEMNIYDIDEVFRDEMYDKYIEHEGIIYKIDGEDNGKTESYINMNKLENGNIEFATRFYNGGTGLDEMLEEGLINLKLGKEKTKN